MSLKPAHPVRPGGLSKADRNRILVLAGRGFTPGRIAVSIEKHPGTVRWFMTRHGLVRVAYSTRSFRRGGRLVKPFDRDEDALIAALRCQDFTHRRIAELVTKRFGHPRNKDTIAQRLVRLAAMQATQEIPSA